MTRNPARERGSSGIFISYRREDSLGQVNYLSEKLRDRFGDYAVFMDRTDIAPGTAFPDRIRQAIASSAVVLVVIGKDWLHARDHAGRRRLDDPKDWVRVEVALALDTPDVLIIPVLVGAASLPTKAQLPPGLQRLPDLNAVALRDTDWNADFETLSASIGVAVRRRDAGVVGGLSLALAAATCAALLLVAARTIAPLQAPADVGARYAVALASAAAGAAGWTGMAGRRRWLAGLARTVRRPAVTAAALALVALSWPAYAVLRPVVLSVEDGPVFYPCQQAYLVQPYATDAHWRQGPPMQAGRAPCETEFENRYERVSIRTGWWSPSAPGTLEIEVDSGRIAAVLAPTANRDDVYDASSDRPAAKSALTFNLDIRDAADFACWFTVQATSDRVHVQATLKAGETDLGRDSTWVPIPVR